PPDQAWSAAATVAAAAAASGTAATADPGSGNRGRRRRIVGPPVPRWLYVPAALGLLFLVMPLVALLVRADWAAFPAAITSDEALQALWLSIKCSVAAVVL